MVWQGLAWSGRAGLARQARHGPARRGRAGRVRQGLEGRGVARQIMQPGRVNLPGKSHNLAAISSVKQIVDMQFTKLFSSILDSTIWQEPKETKIVWITLLAMVDRNGEVYASIPGLASRAGVTLAECEAAIECLSGPDKYSRTKDNDGRRIEEIDGGWILLNHGKYRELLSSEERKEYNRRKQAERRARLKKKPSKVSLTVNDGSMNVNRNQQCQHITDTEVDTEANGTARANTPKRGTFEKISLSQRARTIGPDRNEVIMYAHNNGISREVADAFFDACEARKWLHKDTGEEMGSVWPAALRGYNRSWKSNEQRRRNGSDKPRSLQANYADHQDYDPHGSTRI